jgi:TonB family protein
MPTWPNDEPTSKKEFCCRCNGTLFLLALLMIGPAFFVATYDPADSSNRNSKDEPITVVPNATVEKTLSAGAKFSPALPSLPESTEQRAKQRTAWPLKKLPQVDLSKPVFRNRVDNQQSIPGIGTSEATADRERQVDNVLESIRKQLSSGNKTGPNIFGGNTDVDYQQFVEAVYDNAWLAPDDLAAEAATVKVSVTISRNGAVVSSKILRRSGVSALDKSIEGALDRVKMIGRPFADSDQESQRMFIINFKLRACFKNVETKFKRVVGA